MTNPNAAKEKKLKKVTAHTMESLLSEMEGKFVPPKVGEMVEGKAMVISSNKIFVDIEGKAVGVIEGREMMESRQTVEDLAIGDTICASVSEIENEDGHMVLSLKKADAERGMGRLKELLTKGEATSGRVIEANKGGLLLECEGIQGFMPVSQLAPHHYPRVAGGDKDEIFSRLSKLVGENLPLKVLTLDPEQGKIIFSEKEALDPKERLKALEKFSVGQEISGIVTGIVSFGAFVRLSDDVEGLIHISEITWDRVNNITDHLKVGDQVKVMIIGIEGERISLSLKRLLADPWVGKVKDVKEGAEVEGVVTRVTPFGAFVELGEGLEGLVHVSEMSEEPVADPSKILALGQRTKFKVLAVDAPAHKIALSLKGIKEA